MPSQNYKEVNYEEVVKNIIKSLEDYKESNAYKDNLDYKSEEKAVELLELEVKSQQRTYDELFEMAQAAKDTDISYADRMLVAGDKVRELQSKLNRQKEILEAKKEKVEKAKETLLKKEADFEKYVSDLYGKKEKVEKTIKSVTNKVKKWNLEIDALKSKEDKTEVEVKKLNDLIAKREAAKEERKVAREELGELNKALKVVEEYKKEKGIVTEKETKKKRKRTVKTEKKTSKEEPEKEEDKEKTSEKPKKEEKESSKGEPEKKEGEGKGKEPTTEPRAFRTPVSTPKTIPDDEAKSIGDETSKGPKSTVEKGEVEAKVIPGRARPAEELHHVGEEVAKDPKPKVEDRDAYSNTYKKSLDEYTMMLEMYNEDLNRLYALQEKYENGTVYYFEYQNHADYMVERYRFIMNEYDKVKAQYESEKRKTTTTVGKETKKQLWHPDLTQEQIDYIRSELDIYEPVGQEYEQALRQLGLDPSKQPKQENVQAGMTLEELEARKRELYAMIAEQQMDPDEYQFRTHKENGLEGYEEDDIDRELKEINEKIRKIKESELEPPIKPEQPMMIAEKDKGGPGKEPDLHPAISFSEVLAKTQTAHVGRFENFLYKFSNLKPPISKNNDTFQNVLGVLPYVATLPFKLLAKPVSLAMGTKGKIEEMRDNIANLSPEEFAVLTESAETLNERAGRVVKDEFDTEYLDTQTMKERKINTAYLDVVGERLESQYAPILEAFNVQITELEQESADIVKELQECKDPTRRVELENRFKEIESIIPQFNLEAREIKDKVDSYKFGVEHKTGKYKDIKGWLFARTDPDNRELNKQMADLARQRREAAARGEQVAVGEISAQMRELSTSSTKVHTIGTNINNRVDRGLNSRGPVTFANMQEQNKGRLILANVAIASTITRTITDIHNYLEAQRANAANQQITGTAVPSSSLKKEIDSATAQEAAKEELANTGMHEYDAVYRGQYGADSGPGGFHDIQRSAAADGVLTTGETNSRMMDTMKNLDSGLLRNGNDHPVDLWDHSGARLAIQQLGNGQAFNDLIAALNQPITVTATGQMVGYLIDPVTYGTLVSTILSTRNEAVEARRSEEKKETPEKDKKVRFKGFSLKGKKSKEQEEVTDDEREV